MFQDIFDAWNLVQGGFAFALAQGVIATAQLADFGRHKGREQQTRQHADPRGVQHRAHGQLPRARTGQFADTAQDAHGFPRRAMQVCRRNRVEIGQDQGDVHPTVQHMFDQIGPRAPDRAGLGAVQPRQGIEHAKAHDDLTLGPQNSAFKGGIGLGRGDQNGVVKSGVRGAHL